jgi:hypothetical protein
MVKNRQVQSLVKPQPLERNPMPAELLKLIDTIGSAITPANVESFNTLILNLISLAESLKQDVSQTK